MNEAQARSWIRDRFGVSRETVLQRYGELLLAEAPIQNLISASTLDSIWSRHFVDSAQLVPLAGDAPSGMWLDVGSGAGLPGIVAAILQDRPVALCEPRARRAEFLAAVVRELNLEARVSVQMSKAEAYRPDEPVAIISARAVSELSQLLRSAAHCADLSTIWLLPKGRSAQSEVDAARGKWQGTFHVEPSITQPESGIVIARGVRPR
ncbi:16S rRNA (guanine(527)-N(7))-methyltransferase RsmG [Sphingomonas gei]|uniref:Ribosomal RNA small subunit methyltransferase G n=1 Tax=Sphingomonas gei TaxID=1395960 RepID=A0A4S1XB31_9SPHN|nr:16S rRNA (guanine(527)-N(7))-methyltransferase RsmG [Sphingomonas gei]TGX53321.1 16S rRNA (guanine(527)-N(7))-methyltransferase RsmG [Sphingomonas gei]